MKTIIRFMTFMMLCLVLTCCVAVGGQSDKDGNNQSGTSGNDSSSNKDNKDKKTNAQKAAERTAKLDALYNNTTLGEVTLTFTQDNWNTLVSNSESGNKTLYSTCDYKYVKDGATYEMTGIGIKNRGNTSFRAPHNGVTYQQAHFKCKFNKYTDDNAHQLAKAAKTMNLKYMLSDASYVQEIYSYDLFKRFGVWTAPRAAYTKLYIKIGSNDPLYFGMYKAIENVDKQYLKARMAAGQFSSDEGNLWKCLYQSGGPADLRSTSDSLFGVDTVSKTPVYSLKTNEDDATTKAAAITQFKTFISNLNSKSGSEFNTWIASAFDVDGFLKALAVDVACGMWDDIWRNFNNYYFYFDTNGKAYFIPYDYDNSLGAPNSGLMQHPAEQNPLEWGVNQSVLVKKILDIDEYKTKYKNYLSDLASDSNDYLKLSASQSRINAWYNLIETYCSGYAASSECSKDGESDWSLHKGRPSSLYNFLTNENNYFTLRIQAINDAVGGSSGNNGGNGGNNPTTAELIGYDVSGDNITFTFDPTMYGLTADSITTDLYICGSFTSWDINESYKMTESDGIWSLTVNKPDNNSTYKYRTSSNSWYGANSRISGYAVPSGYFVSSSSDDNGNIIIKY